VNSRTLLAAAIVVLAAALTTVSVRAQRY